jgi:hypothetical protein
MLESCDTLGKHLWCPYILRKADMKYDLKDDTEISD